MKGRCNICAGVGPLTRDHIFPLGTIRVRPLEVRTLTQALSCEPSQPQQAYGSVERRTICEECNSKRLGQTYDPHLKDLCEQVALWIRSNYELHLSLPSSFSVRFKPHRVARAIVGHLLAAEIRPEPYAPLVSAPMPDAMRQYFLDETQPMPERLELHCWPYPSEMQVIIRAAGYGRPGHVITGDFMKFFPLAYWVAWDRPPSVTIPLPRISLSRECGLDDEASVTIQLDGVPPIDWPEHPSSHDLLLVNDEMTILSQPRGSV